MKILALLPDDAREVLERSLTGAQQLSQATGAAAAAAAIRERRCDALVVDPGMLDDAEFESVLKALNASGLPALMYATLGSDAAKRVVRAVDGTARELVLRRSDDVPELLKKHLAALVAPSASALLLSKAAAHFRNFPDKLQVASVSLFGRATLPRWVPGLVKETGLARRTVDRWMHAGGIHGAARLLDAVRLARVWEPLAEREMNPEQVAARFGYERLRLLAAHTKRIAGVAPHELGAHYNRKTFSSRLADALID